MKKKNFVVFCFPYFLLYFFYYYFSTRQEKKHKMQAIIEIAPAFNDDSEKAELVKHLSPQDVVTGSQMEEFSSLLKLPENKAHAFKIMFMHAPKGPDYSEMFEKIMSSTSDTGSYADKYRINIFESYLMNWMISPENHHALKVVLQYLIEDDRRAYAIEFVFAKSKNETETEFPQYINYLTTSKNRLKIAEMIIKRIVTPRTGVDPIPISVGFALVITSYFKSSDEIAALIHSMIANMEARVDYDIFNQFLDRVPTSGYDDRYRIKIVEDLLTKITSITSAEAVSILSRFTDTQCKQKVTALVLKKIKQGPVVPSGIPGIKLNMPSKDKLKAFTTEEDDTRACKICFERVPNWSLACGHKMCGPCLSGIMDSGQGICTDCRKPINGALQTF